MTLTVRSAPSGLFRALLRPGLWLLAALPLATPAVPAHGQAGSLDVTNLIIEYTDLEHEVFNLCRRICAGNHRIGWLQSAKLMTPPGAQGFTRIRVEMMFRSRQLPARNFTLYDTTARVFLTADIDNKTCQVREAHISSTHTLYQVLIGIFRTQIERAAEQLKPIC
jgi:hypothetical protein